MKFAKIQFLSQALGIFFLSLTLLASTLVKAADSSGSEEISYDDLVNQLSSRRKATQQSTNDPFDSIKIHTGIGLITSASELSVGGSSSYRSMNGFQLSAGIDLFSSNWLAEGTLRNFGESSSGSETRSLREYDLKALYRNQLANNWGYRVGAGIGSRTLHFSDSSSGVSANDTTPVTVLVGGFDVTLSPLISLGVEAGLRTAMVTSTADKNSADLTLHVDASF